MKRDLVDVRDDLERLSIEARNMFANRTGDRLSYMGTTTMTKMLNHLADTITQLNNYLNM